ncbi:MAG TPA: hypothetical protein VHP13_12100 [Gammaproteobacteria bacterium]|jgi:hypothetical protein|nr:hypothetical protein [Gammaproteobacteria bacterium]
MPTLKNASLFLLACCLIVVLSEATSASATASGPPAATARDGQHDFDWESGSWHTHVKRRLHPLTGSDTWAEYDGTSAQSPVWGGKANLLELEVDGPQGHLELLSLRLYDPQTRQWSLNVASSRGGGLGMPTVGAFKDGKAEFYDDEDFGGKPVRVRFVISDIKAGSAHFEQAFSADGGKTWETNWIADDLRIQARGGALRPQGASL